MQSTIWKFCVFSLSIAKGILHIFIVSVGVQLLSHLPFVRMTDTALMFLACTGYFASIYWIQIPRAHFRQHWVVREGIFLTIPSLSVMFLFSGACLTWQRNHFLLVLYALLLWSILLYFQALLKQNSGKPKLLSKPSSK